jgi:hypothetical protein
MLVGTMEVGDMLAHGVFAFLKAVIPLLPFQATWDLAA